MLPKELIKKIRQIDIITNRVVTDVLAGRYHSVFKGRGIEFSEVREYQFGDDIRSIDWNVFARTGNPYIKKFVEEREMTVLVMVDVSASMRFGTKFAFKSETAAEIAALFSFSAIRNNDKVGLLLFSDKVEKYIPPKKGKSHVLSLIRDILYCKSTGKSSQVSVALEYVEKVLKKKSVIVIISDFLFEGYEKTLSIMNKRHDIIPIILQDQMEEKFVGSGFIELEDAERGSTLLVSAKRVQADYLENRKVFKEKQKKIFRGNKIEEIEIVSQENYLSPIVKYFKKRELKAR